MNLKTIVTTAAIAGALTMSATTASAMPAALTNFNNHYANSKVALSACLLCHNTASGYTSKALNAFGANFKAAGGSKFASYMPTWATLDGMDADKNGTTNSKQIAAGIAPAGNGTLKVFTTPGGNGGGGNTGGGNAGNINGDNNGTSSSGGGCIASSATTPLMMVLAMLSLGFFVRRKKD
ncbi:MAG: hypothetical protein Q9N02_00410 [Ghiorsea sp.]|nr:hypothetical protein [Ghiorsea sp.]